MVTVAEVINRFSDMANRHTGVDIDGAYGMQCVDLPNALAQWFFGKRMPGNGIDMLAAGRANGWAVLPASQCAPGDIFCKSEPGHGYGHTGLIIARNGNNIRSIDQNYGTNGYGGPCVYVNRQIDGSWLGVTRPPYSDAGRSDGSSGGGEKKPGFPVKDIKYAGYSFSAENQKAMLEWCIKRNLLPSGCICQLYVESNWGASNVARVDNNWGGMTGGAQTRPSGVVVTTGSYRPAAEGGTYMHYASVGDYFNDWTYLISGHGYNCAGKQDINSFTMGLFTVGGAAYNYAAAGYGAYAPQMVSVRNGTNAANGGYLDALDQAWKDGTLGEGYGGQGEGPSEPEEEYPCFMFNAKGYPELYEEGTLFYFNGQINEVQPIHNQEEIKYLNEIYTDSTGRKLKDYRWDKGKDDGVKNFFGVVHPGSQVEAIKKKIDEIIAELDEAVD